MIMVRKQRVKLEKMQLPACGHEAIEEETRLRFKK